MLADAERQKIEAANSTLLRAFRVWLGDRVVAPADSETHELNLEFFLNHYLPYCDIGDPLEAATPERMADFFGEFFVHKAMWTDVDDQKSSIDSLTCFWTWLAEVGQLPVARLKTLELAIRDNQERWFRAMERYKETSLEDWQSTVDEELGDELVLDTDDWTDEDGNEIDLDLSDLVIPEPGGGIAPHDPTADEVEDLEVVRDSDADQSAGADSAQGSSRSGKTGGRAPG